MTTAYDQQQMASNVLWDHWQCGRLIKELPEEIRPATRQAGYDIQARLEERSEFPLFGWKIAATSLAGQAHIAVDGPLAGRLLRERVRDSGGRVPVGKNHMRVAEAEFAFRMATDLLPRRPLSSRRGVASRRVTHPAIEVPDSRFEDFTTVGAAQLIADNACADYFVLGPAAPEVWRTINLAQHRVTGRSVDNGLREGIGAHVLGDPRDALVWLVNELSRLNLPLRAGEVVTTGTCLVPLPIQPGDHVVADFGAIGIVDVWLSD